jgi:hypothetical protein
VASKKNETYLLVVFVIAHSANMGCNASEMNSTFGLGVESGGRSCYEPEFNSASLWEMGYVCVTHLMSHECCGIG